MSQEKYNRPVELWFVGLHNRTLVGSATFCSILKLSCDLICCYVLYFSTQKVTSLAD